MSKETRSAVLLTVAVLVVFGLGIWAGRFLTSVPFGLIVTHWDRAQNLGALADHNNERESRAQAYSDPAKAIAEMDAYGWAPTNVPTPFVGVGPMPGRHTGIDINPQQFRGTRDVVMPKPDGVFRVILTGGSTAFSSGAPSFETTIGGQLEKCLGGSAEVHTYANPAWASTHERIAIVNRLSELAPDVVVSLTGVNDVHWGVRGRDTMWFRTYWEQTFFDIDRRAFELMGRGPLPDPTVVADGPVPVARLAANFEKNVRVANAVLEDVNARYLVALQPSLVTTKKKRTAREAALLEKLGDERRKHHAEAFPAFKERLAEIEGARFAWFDLEDAFSGEPDGTEVFLDSYHFGDRGNRLVATAICTKLKETTP